MSIKTLRDERNEIGRSLRSLLETNPGALWNAECQTKYDDGTRRIDQIDDELKRIQRVADIDGAEPVTDSGKKVPAKDWQKTVHAAWLRGGDRAVSAEDWSRISNTMSTTTAGEGGYTVPTGIANTLIDSLKAFGGMRSVSTIIRTASGNPMNFPASDGTSETGEWIAENTTATGADPAFTAVAVTPYKASSKIVAVPFELLQDSNIDIEAFVNQRLTERLGRITNTGYTVGTGSAQPYGVAARAASGKVGTTGQTTSVIHADLVDLVHAVDPAYRVGNKVAFMMADSSVKVIRKIVDGASRPIWVPSYDSTINLGVPDTLLGYPVVVNQDIAAMAANAKSILFGDFSKYIIRDAMDITLFRFTDSAYAKLGQVGFLAWMRTGGNLTDTAAVKYYANSAT